jgi:lipopolysaccharide biosynthesis glycosyltransferase
LDDEEMPKTINIAYCFDDNYQQHAAASMMSLLCNFSQKPSLISFHLLIDTPSLHMLNFGADLERLFGCRVHFYEMEAYGKEIREKVSDKMPKNSYWTMAAFYRLCLADVLPESVDEILYLDCDTIVFDDVSKLFELDFGTYAAAGVVDIDGESTGVALEIQHYFNSGVLIMKLSLWREQQIGRQCFDYLAAPDAFAPFPDQDAINKVLDGKILALSARWNRVIVNRRFEEELVKNAKSRSSILHYITKEKPWHAWYSNQLGEWYWTYLRASPWKNPVLQQLRTTGEAHKMAKKAVQEGQLGDAVEFYEMIAQRYLT